jgi:hypothetical protein
MRAGKARVLPQSRCCVCECARASRAVDREREEERKVSKLAVKLCWSHGRMQTGHTWQHFHTGTALSKGIEPQGALAST